MFCIHKYGKVEDGYQYCSKCGKAVVIPCNHKWENIAERSSTLTGHQNGFIQQCEKCGELREWSIGSGYE